MFSTYKILGLSLILCPLLSHSGDLKARYRDYEEKERHIKGIQGVIGVNEAMGNFVALGSLKVADDFLLLHNMKGAPLKKRIRYLLDHKGGRKILMVGGIATAIGVDGLGRLYLAAEGKDPTLTPLPGMVAWTLSPNGAAQEIKEGAEFIIKRTSEKLPDGIDAVFNGQGILKSMKVLGKAVQATRETLREPAENENH